MVNWDKLPKEFLAGWVKTLMESIEKNVDEETRQKIFAETGSFCAKAHAESMFKDMKLKTNDIKVLVEILNKNLPGTKWELIGHNQLKIIYEQCFCPLINSELHKNTVQCDCSEGWLHNNLEILFNKDVKIEQQTTVLKGGKQCEFIASF